MFSNSVFQLTRSALKKVPSHQRPFTTGLSAGRRFLAQPNSSLTRKYATELKKGTDQDMFLRFAKDFSILLAEDRNALKFIRSNLSYSKSNDEDPDRLEKLSKKYEFISEIIANKENHKKLEIVYSTVKVAALLVEMADGVLFQAFNSFPDDFAENTFIKFGLKKQVNHTPGASGMRGKFINYNSDKIPEVLNCLKPVRYFAFDGIEQSRLQGDIRPDRMLDALNALRIDTDENDIASYQYTSTPGERGRLITKYISQNVLTLAPEQVGVAETILNSSIDPEGKLNLNRFFLGYSIGAAVLDETLSAMYDILSKKVGDIAAKKAISDTRSLCVGMQPFRTENRDWMNNLSSINILSSTDIVAPHSGWTKALALIHSNMGEGEPDCVAYVSKTNPNQVLLYVSPKAIPITITKKDGKTAVNVGGHGLHPYLATFGIGMVEEERKGISKKMLKAGEVIMEYAQGNNFSKKSLKDQLIDTGIDVQDLDKEKFKNTLNEQEEKNAYNKLLNAMAMQLAKEMLKNGGTHPLLKILNQKDQAPHLPF